MNVARETSELRCLVKMCICCEGIYTVDRDSSSDGDVKNLVAIFVVFDKSRLMSASGFSFTLSSLTFTNNTLHHYATHTHISAPGTEISTSIPRFCSKI